MIGVENNKDVAAMAVKQQFNDAY